MKNSARETVIAFKKNELITGRRTQNDELSLIVVDKGTYLTFRFDNTLKLNK